MYQILLYLLAAFLVQDVSGLSVTICANNNTQIRCNNSETIRITRAVYGRLSRSICPELPMNSTECESIKSMKVVKERCHGRKNCWLYATVKQFDNACYLTSKYLQVEYECDPPAYPPAPQNLGMHKTDGTTAEFMYSMPDEWTQLVSKFEFILIDKVTETNRTFAPKKLFIEVTDLILNREYEIKVRAKSALGFGPFTTLSFRTLPSTVTVMCESGWKPFDNYCFRYENTSMNWMTARDSCHHYGSYLTSIWQKGLQNFIDKWMSNFNGGYAYIGLNDIEKDKTFVWADGFKFSKNSFKFFNAAQTKKTGLDCVAIKDDNGTAYWLYEQCDVKHPSICKKPKATEHLHKPYITGIDKLNLVKNVSLNSKCMASSPNFVAEYLWLKNGIVIHKGIDLKFNALQKIDEGEYTCEVVYNHDVVLSTDPVNLKIQSILKKSQNKVKKEGKRVLPRWQSHQ